ncbi:hypothetical protein [Pseudarthrobacter sp. NamE5]|uniref:hypothetical protein n=1 Tax=Pseudarthrobacter sp. NamE5 TaxID=2576839 RepID=UPI00110A8346|nr:hypothetical protein [Pseudarthrobacter sp. NamE5]TLM88226.1 hypothetical protein FDW84_01545 [Pseudarthrobacter sp. NamE5]
MVGNGFDEIVGPYTAARETAIVRSVGLATGIASLVWAVVVSDLAWSFDYAGMGWATLFRLLTILVALVVYFTCRRKLGFRSQDSVGMILGAVVAFLVDTALSFYYSGYFGLLCLAWGISLRKPYLAAAGALAAGAAVVSRFMPSVEILAVVAAGVLILAATYMTVARSRSATGHNL